MRWLRRQRTGQIVVVRPDRNTWCSEGYPNAPEPEDAEPGDVWLKHGGVWLVKSESGQWIRSGG